MFGDFFGAGGHTTVEEAALAFFCRDGVGDRPGYVFATSTFGRWSWCYADSTVGRLIEDFAKREGETIHNALTAEALAEGAIVSMTATFGGVTYNFLNIQRVSLLSDFITEANRRDAEEKVRTAALRAKREQEVVDKTKESP